MNRINLLLLLFFTICMAKIAVNSDKQKEKEVMQNYITLTLNKEFDNMSYITVNHDELLVICYDGIPEKVFDDSSPEMDDVWVDCIDSKIFSSIVWCDNDTMIIME